MNDMRRQTIEKIQRHTLWLSLLGHLLMLMGFTIVLVMAPHDMPSSDAPQSVPSYLSPSPEQAPAEPARDQKADPKPEPQPEPKPEPEVKQTDKNGIEKPVTKKTEEVKTASKISNKFDPRTVSFSKDTVPEDMTNPRDNEPLRLVGENKIIKPLVKILARALSKHLVYPRVAADFNLRGVVLVGFVINPDGYVTEARVVQSSGAGVLDDAARDAVGSMSPVGDVREFVPAPQFLVVGIIFG